MRRESKVIQIVLDSLEQRHSCFILGAGASTPIVPLAAQLSGLVTARLLRVGVFPAVPIHRDHISARILGTPTTPIDPFDPGQMTRAEIIASRLSPAAVKAATVELLRPDPPKSIPPQYGIFNLSKHRLKLINFNNDGLANEFCRGHAIVNVHGTSISVEQRLRSKWNSWVDFLQAYPEASGFDIPSLILPQREPVTMANSQAYRQTRRLIHDAARMVFVGYSFGEMDDYIAYELFKFTIRRKRIEAVIAKPNPSDLVWRLSEDCRSESIYGLPVYWDKFSTAIFSSIVRPKYKTCDHNRLCSRCVAYLYQLKLDAAP